MKKVFFCFLSVLAVVVIGLGAYTLIYQHQTIKTQRSAMDKLTNQLINLETHNKDLKALNQTLNMENDTYITDMRLLRKENGELKQQVSVDGPSTPDELRIAVNRLGTMAMKHSHNKSMASTAGVLFSAGLALALKDNYPEKLFKHIEVFNNELLREMKENDPKPGPDNKT